MEVGPRCDMCEAVAFCRDKKGCKGPVVRHQENRAYHTGVGTNTGDEIYATRERAQRAAVGWLARLLHRGYQPPEHDGNTTIYRGRDGKKVTIREDRDCASTMFPCVRGSYDVSSEVKGMPGDREKKHFGWRG